MKVVFSWIFYWMGDASYRLFGAFGFGAWAYQKLMKASVELDTKGRVWKFVPKSKFGKWKTTTLGRRKRK